MNNSNYLAHANGMIGTYHKEVSVEKMTWLLNSAKADGHKAVLVFLTNGVIESVDAVTPSHALLLDTPWDLILGVELDPEAAVAAVKGWRDPVAAQIQAEMS